MVANSKTLNKDLKKGLYLVSTPIGNLSDITFRAIEILKKSDFILCEDTRVSKNLFKKYEIKSKLISNHKFNETKNLSKVIEILKKDLIVSLVSDAGTPGISDPGAILINECKKNNIEITPVPGPSAVSSAVAISGFSEKFFFYGFLPDKIKTLNNDLEMLSKLNCSIVFFISSKKINKVIQFLKNFFSGRKILICREMTKLYEEYIRMDVDKIQAFDEKLRGELTIVISENNMNKKISQKLSESDKINIGKMINKLTIKEIVNLISSNNKVSKKEIYNYCLVIKNEI
tara:strand:- start:2416 stop:3279 length:864 start_codon:yes stop_codon:yes gene_type:complete